MGLRAYWIIGSRQDADFFIKHLFYKKPRQQFTRTFCCLIAKDDNNSQEVRQGLYSVSGFPKERYSRLAFKIVKESGLIKRHYPDRKRFTRYNKTITLL